MKNLMLKRSVVFIFILLLIDQVVKIWIKTNMMLGEEYKIMGDWFRIHFVENNGMAFGMEIAGEWGKLILTVFRLFAIVGIAWYLKKLCKEKAPVGVIISFALIFAGALGNIIDSVFYGVIFNHSVYQVSTFLPEAGGYANLLHGKVVDMFYFPIVDTNFPSWFPIWGGEHFMFFRPVFNVADSYITIGVSIILLFNRSFFVEEKK